jgi:hypothetical protein
MKEEVSEEGSDRSTLSEAMPLRRASSRANEDLICVKYTRYRGNSFTGDLSLKPRRSNSLSQALKSISVMSGTDQRQTAEITKRKFEKLFSSEFWKSPQFFEDFCEILFHIKKRKTTIRLEIYCGVIQFISCMIIIFFKESCG